QFSAIAGVERDQGLVLGHEYGAVVFADDVRGVGVGDGGVAGIGVECRTGPVVVLGFLGWCGKDQAGALMWAGYLDRAPGAFSGEQVVGGCGVACRCVGRVLFVTKNCQGLPGSVGGDREPFVSGGSLYCPEG